MKLITLFSKNTLNKKKNQMTLNTFTLFKRNAVLLKKEKK